MGLFGFIVNPGNISLPADTPENERFHPIIDKESSSNIHFITKTQRVFVSRSPRRGELYEAT